MSTLSMASPRVAPESEVGARFDALVRAVPAQRDHRDGAAFETVFDLDYWQPVTDPACRTRPSRFTSRSPRQSASAFAPPTDARPRRGPARPVEAGRCWCSHSSAWLSR